MPNTEDNFKWDESLIKEMIYSKLPIPDHYMCNLQKCLDEFKKSKQPVLLFTTEDNIKIYEGDEYVKVNDYSDYSLVTGFTANGNHNDYKGKKFSTKEAANEFILMNKPCLSVNDIRTVLNLFPYQIDQLKELVQKK